MAEMIGAKKSLWEQVCEGKLKSMFTFLLEKKIKSLNCVCFGEFESERPSPPCEKWTDTSNPVKPTAQSTQIYEGKANSFN